MGSATTVNMQNTERTHELRNKASEKVRPRGINCSLPRSCHQRRPLHVTTLKRTDTSSYKYKTIYVYCCHTRREGIQPQRSLILPYLSVVGAELRSSAHHLSEFHFSEPVFFLSSGLQHGTRGLTFSIGAPGEAVRSPGPRRKHYVYQHQRRTHSANLLATEVWLLPLTPSQKGFCHWAKCASP